MDNTPIEQSDWEQFAISEIGSPEGTALAEKILPVAVAQIREILQTEPQILDHVNGVLQAQFGKGIDTETHGRIMTSIQSLIGLDPCFLLIWLAHSQSNIEEQNHRFGVLSSYAPPNIVIFYRILIARFGSDIEKALIRFDELPDNWTVISREVYYDKLRERYLFKVWIEKFNGEKVLIEGPPDSILLMCANLLSMCSVVEKEAYSEDRIAIFSEEAKTFTDLIFPEEDPAPAAS